MAVVTELSSCGIVAAVNASRLGKVIAIWYVQLHLVQTVKLWLLAVMTELSSCGIAVAVNVSRLGKVTAIYYVQLPLVQTVKC